MPSSAVRTFTDPDDFAAAVHGSQAEVTILGRGQFSAKLTRIELHRLWTQLFSDNLPRISHVAWLPILAARAVVSFRTAAGPPPLWGSLELHSTNIVRHSKDENTFQRSSGSFSSVSMSLPDEEIASTGGTMAGLDATPPNDAMLISPTLSAMAKLQRLHAAAVNLAEDAPEIIAHPEAARGLEQALIEAMVECLAGGEPRENSLAQGQHAIVMRRFRRVVEDNTEHPLYIPEICNSIGVSSRTLQTCCHEHLGMGPKHYLLLRRMHLARRALRQASPDAASVTETATRYGFWQLGRFAVEYHSLFGESPSATLAHQLA
jgi:AraC-like DNA-binding protein